MEEDPVPTDAHISIGAAARAADLRPDVVRAWERRYGAVSPVRTETGRRRYTRDQVDRLCLLAKATRAGHAISAVACLSLDELRQLTATATLSPAAERRPGSRVVEAFPESDPLVAGIEAIREFDAAALRSLLERGLARVGSEHLIDGVIAPLLHRVGAAWESGELTEAHEHFVTAVVRTFLGGLTTAIPDSPSAPVVVVATPEGERHELGALLVAWAAVIEGWRAVYLGPDLPPAALGAAARAIGAQGIALSVTCGASDEALEETFEEIRALDGLPVWIGGSGRERVASPSTNVRSLESIEALRGELRAWPDLPPVA